jgi:hypothetical protein
LLQAPEDIEDAGVKGSRPLSLSLDDDCWGNEALPPFLFKIALKRTPDVLSIRAMLETEGARRGKCASNATLSTGLYV